MLLCFAVTTTAFTQDWPQWRGPNANGITSESGWNPDALDGTLTPRWKAQVGVGFSSMAVRGQYVYTMGNASYTDTVYCLDFDTGTVIWEHSYPCMTGSYPGPRATPTVDGNHVYTLSREGHLFCLDALSGDVVWEKHLKNDFSIKSPTWDFAGSVVVVGNLLILNAGRSGLGLNKADGELVWSSGQTSGGYATPVVYRHDDREITVIFGASAVYGVDLSDGEVLWSYPWGPSNQVNAADPVVHDEKVFISSAYGYGSGLVDFRGNAPELVWRSGIYQAHFSSFIFVDGYLYGIDGDARQSTSGVLRCVDFDTGKERWSERVGFGSLIAAGEYLVILNSIGVITVAELNNRRFRLVARGELPRNQYWTSPVLVGKRLLCRNIRGEIYCLDL